MLVNFLLGESVILTLVNGEEFRRRGLFVVVIILSFC
jgi:hypothetical protein